MTKNAFIPIAIMLVTACASTQPPVAATHGIARNTHGWMLPDAAGRDLLYVTKTFLPNGGTYVYTYPGLRLIGMLDYEVGAEGTCVDGNGDVFIVENRDGSQPAVYEYAHGGDTLIARIGLPVSGQGCSVDATSRRLAVTSARGKFQFVIVDYKPHGGGWHLSRGFTVPGMTAGGFCSFDDRGNLFVDGAGTSQGVELVEMPKGSHQLTTITLDENVQSPGQVQWHDKYLSVGDTNSTVYEFAISGSTGTKVATTSLGGSGSLAQYWIQGRTLVGPNSQGSVGLWRYPKGGTPKKTLDFSDAFGAVVSLGQQPARP